MVNWGLQRCAAPYRFFGRIFRGQSIEDVEVEAAGVSIDPGDSDCGVAEEGVGDADQGGDVELLSRGSGHEADAGGVAGRAVAVGGAGRERVVCDGDAGGTGEAFAGV